MKNSVLISLLILTSFSSAADSFVRGTVTLQGKPQRGVLVSNGDTIVKTDRHGLYILPRIENCNVFPILDNNREIISSRIINAAFPPASEDTEVINFDLAKKLRSNNFSINFIGDVQVGDDSELEYAARSLWPELMADSTAKYNIWLGDLVNNNIKLYPRIRRMIETLPTPSFTLVGNHDRDVDSIRLRQTNTFSRIMGAPVYSFNEGNIHFIVLNTVYGDGPKSYKGMLDDRQLRFIKEDLKYVDADKRIVICAHIPLAYIKNREALTNLLKGRGDVLAITGHEHSVFRHFIPGDGVTIHELVAGATCGFWWVGEKDWEGIPSALMQCGTPKGYFRFNFSDTGYNFSFKGTGMDANRQIGLWAAGLDTIVSKGIRDMEDLQPTDVLATVYGACDSTRVECRLDGRQLLPVEKFRHIEPNVARIRDLNLRKIYPTKGSRKNPFRKTPSPQLWKIQLPDSIKLDGSHFITVTATDKYGLRASGRRPL